MDKKTKVNLNRFLREEIVNSKSRKEIPDKKTFLEYITNSLKLATENKWSFLCSAMDTICDSQEVIEEFLEFGMEGKTKVSTRGEKLIRLYGILNAINVEKNALFELSEIWNFKTKEKIKSLNDLKIFELRNISAHIGKYKNKDKIECFFIDVGHISNFKITVVRHSGFNKYDYKLDNLVDEYQTVSFYFFLEIIKKAIESIYKTEKDKKNDLLVKVQEYQDVFEGKVIVNSFGGNKFKIL